VGLVQREIEAAGFSTITLANIPDLAQAVGAPRVAGIEHPFGQNVGAPGDRATQLVVLRAALEAIASYLVRHPWHVRNLLKREIPEKYRV